MCRVETITFVYPDGRSLRQPYYSLCERSDGRSPCRDARYFDLGERIRVPANSSHHAMDHSSSRQSGAFMHRSNSTSKTTHLKPSKKLPSHNNKLPESESRHEGERKGPSSTHPLSSRQFAPSTGRPVTLNQPNPPPITEKQRRFSTSTRDSRSSLPKGETRGSKSPKHPSMKRQNSTTAKHERHASDGSRRLSTSSSQHTPLPTHHTQRSPTATRPTAFSPPLQSPKNSPDSVAVETGDNPEVSRYIHRDEARRQAQKAAQESTARANAETENAALKRELEQAQLDLVRQQERIQEFERRLSQVELGNRGDANQQADYDRKTDDSRTYRTDIRYPKGRYRQEQHHTDEKGRVAISERSKPRQSGDSSRPSTRRSDERTNTSSARTPHSEGRTLSRTTSSRGSDIDDETQEESENDARPLRGILKGKERKRPGKH